MGKESEEMNHNAPVKGHHSGHRSRNDETSRFRDQMLHDRPKRRKKYEMLLKGLLTVVALALIAFIMLMKYIG